MTEPATLWLAYDGECPLCRMGVRAMRIREAAGTLNLLDARTQGGHPVLQEIRARGLDVDKGMVLKWGDNFYHGADALQALALLGTDSDWVNRMNARVFRSKALARLGYPLMKAGRRLALWMKGVPPL